MEPAYQQASHVQRIQETLEDANLKLASCSDIIGRPGRTVLAALAAGETDPERPRALVAPRVEASPEAIRAALTGRPGPHHRLLLGLHLGQASPPSAPRWSAEVERDLGPFREAVGLLVTIRASLTSPRRSSCPGSAATWAASRLPDTPDLLGRPCPRQDESALASAAPLA